MPEILEHAIQLGCWINLASSAAAILFCALVAKNFSRVAWGAVRNREHSSQEWLICGVFVSFACKVLDGSYWELTWTLDYLASPLSELGKTIGPTVNVLTRNTLWIVAGYCHLRGLAEAAGQADRLEAVSRQFNACCLFGVSYALVIEIIRQLGVAS